MPVSVVCEYGVGTETAEHFLFVHCCQYKKAGEVMMDKLSEICNMSKSKHQWSLNVTENLLLAPASNDVSKRDNLQIKEALFEFLASVNKNI